MVFSIYIVLVRKAMNISDVLATELLPLSDQSYKLFTALINLFVIIIWCMLMIFFCHSCRKLF